MPQLPYWLQQKPSAQRKPLGPHWPLVVTGRALALDDGVAIVEDDSD